MSRGERLTGRSRIRQQKLTGKLVLMLEFEWDEIGDDGSHGNSGSFDHYTKRQWRDAKVEDYIMYVTGDTDMDENPAPQPEPPPAVRKAGVYPLKKPNGGSSTAGPVGRLP